MQAFDRSPREQAQKVFYLPSSLSSLFLFSLFPSSFSISSHLLSTQLHRPARSKTPTFRLLIIPHFYSPAADQWLEWEVPKETQVRYKATPSAEHNNSAKQFGTIMTVGRCRFYFQFFYQLSAVNSALVRRSMFCSVGKYVSQKRGFEQSSYQVAWISPTRQFHSAPHCLLQISPLSLTCPTPHLHLQAIGRSSPAKTRALLMNSSSSWWRQQVRAKDQVGSEHARNESADSERLWVRLSKDVRRETGEKDVSEVGREGKRYIERERERKH